MHWVPTLVAASQYQSKAHQQTSSLPEYLPLASLHRREESRTPCQGRRSPRLGRSKLSRNLRKTVYARIALRVMFQDSFFSFSTFFSCILRVRCWNFPQMLWTAIRKNHFFPLFDVVNLLSRKLRQSALEYDLFVAQPFFSGFLDQYGRYLKGNSDTVFLFVFKTCAHFFSF